MCFDPDATAGYTSRYEPITHQTELAAALAGSVTGCDLDDDIIITINVDSEQKISESDGNFNGILQDNTEFGYAVAVLGDLEADGVTDLLVSAPMDNDGGPERGAAWILFMDDDGNADTETKISARDGDFNGRLRDGDRFGSAVAGIGDLNGDGFLDAAIGAPFDKTLGIEKGAAWILFMDRADTSTECERNSFFRIIGVGDCG